MYEILRLIGLYTDCQSQRCPTAENFSVEMDISFAFAYIGDIKILGVDTIRSASLFENANN